jgi:alpha/beta superfamily hydrolase
MKQMRDLWIDGPAGRLEAIMRLAEPVRAAAVIAHPHPPQGGTMHNPVVFHAESAMYGLGFTTLRFNFRGVGASEGSFDDGRGELDDLAAAVAEMRKSIPDFPLFAVGYSFGAWCAARLAAIDDGISAFVAIGLPTVFHHFEELEQLGRPVAVIQGSDDELGSLEDVEALLSRCKPAGRLYVAEGCGHLFPGRAAEAGALVAEACEAILS